MNIACPHCSQVIELTPEVHASLQGQPHLACPSCQGLMAVPPMSASAPKQAPRRPAEVHKAAMQAQRGLNRNILVLGVVALLLLGGLAAFLASRNGGSVFNIFQNTTNQIIHNSYFTQLIASGVTTEEDLKSIGDIRPYGDGFIGVSKEPLTWEQSQDLAKRTGAEVLGVEAGSKQELLAWLGKTFSAHLSAPVWLSENGAASLLAGSEVLASKEMERQRKVLLHWQVVAVALTAATKDKPFVNSLGMKFVPVPDTKVLFSIHETRRQDYAAYAAAVPGVSGWWKNVLFRDIPSGDKDDHPVCLMSWEDSVKFCDWLSKKEGKTYRLPTDAEWSIAVGLGHLEKRGDGITPELLNLKEQTHFPWEEDFPPTTKNKAGNYADESWHEKLPKGPWIEKYNDGYATTAPAMSFEPNKTGLYDMGGNVWEWVGDWWNAAQKEHVYRGASFHDEDRGYLLSSYRHHTTPGYRYYNIGFRVVLEVSASTQASSATDKPQ